MEGLRCRECHLGARKRLGHFLAFGWWFGERLPFWGAPREKAPARAPGLLGWFFCKGAAFLVVGGGGWQEGRVQMPGGAPK